MNNISIVDETSRGLSPCKVKYDKLPFNRIS